MTWEPYASLSKGETIAYTLQLTKAVKAKVVFYGPEATWYSVLIVAGRRVSEYVKSAGEEQAKLRAVELANDFNRGLEAALYELAGTEPE